MPGVVTVREHETLENRPELKEHLAELEAVAGKALTRRNGHLAVSKYVGVITTKRGLVVEVLPKIDLGDESDAATRHTFLRMLRCWRWWRRQSETLSDSAIRAISRFPMLEIFVRQFLLNLDRLARMGLAQRYVTVEDNLPYLRGRLLFREQLRQNLTNHARFAVSHTPLSVNRPANRLIHTALTRFVAARAERRQPATPPPVDGSLRRGPTISGPVRRLAGAKCRPLHAALRTGDAMG